MNPTLRHFYENHHGKVSDKWSIYLDEYQRLLHPLQDKEVCLLEVGVQNGGSLEIWGNYFSNARNIVGCDIDPKCAELSYINSSIEIVIGDICSPITTQAVLSTCNGPIDIVIDDGSHTSQDIVTTFFNLFGHLKEGGIYIAEDLHCSYWPGFQGGLHHSHSSISFFKRLIDIVNFEHWEEDMTRCMYISELVPINDTYEELLSSIHSVEFINSLCIIKKRPYSENTLGHRIISGYDEIVQQVKDKTGEISKPQK
ncbi:class I SAM-dependent methyltransferase [Pseudomonas coleopterorum]|uniref:Class I SAM-dependent methyltransferase n=1 Tax=Pseudomonas coleopterorum TaxID=1605838 RepID=A0ABR9BY39_9PSED|nr:class I SAM-dependent methyltransferase [Pseudomonas coleopterorum]MBD8754090.1 class I SAM-dependent methyltransferase [Pseudomonas coleopterorum]MBD8769817.1 class I SAM-dependent methyltransferase [Pseudomonas coleopterorum]